MLYAIVDPAHSPAGLVLPLAKACVEGGASYVQLRAKDLPDAQLLELAATLASLCRGRCHLVINDRPDIAALVNAWGAHVGQEDLPVLLARRALLPGQKLGVSTHTLAQVQSAVDAGADLLGFGPVFHSSSKSGHAAVTGLDLLRQAVELAGEVPVVAIGGVDQARARACMEAGAHAVAVIGALANAPDPRAAAEQLVKACLRVRAP